jgi:hypothetical protein
VALFPEMVAVMFAVPTALAVTSPVEFTDATLLFDVVHVAAGALPIVFPCASFAVATSWSLKPGSIERLGALSVTEATPPGATGSPSPPPPQAASSTIVAAIAAIPTFISMRLSSKRSTWRRSLAVRSDLPHGWACRTVLGAVPPVMVEEDLVDPAIAFVPHLVHRLHPRAFPGNRLRVQRFDEDALRPEVKLGVWRAGSWHGGRARD